MFEKIYHDYLLHKNSLNTEERDEGTEGWYHASGAGLCSRKLYYQSIEKIPVQPKSFKALEAKKRSGIRKMGLGTIIHDNIQNALIYYNNIYNNNINNDIVEKEKKELTYKKKSFEVEGEVTIPSLNVRGFYDILLLEDSADHDTPLVKLYDIKTVGVYQWAQRFGKINPAPPGGHYYLQLGTYGLALREKFGNLDYMGLIFYNTDTQIMREVSVPLSYADDARRYWHSIKEEHAKGVPEFRLGTSPVDKWVCNYCDFQSHCRPPKF